MKGLSQVHPIIVQNRALGHGLITCDRYDRRWMALLGVAMPIARTSRSSKTKMVLVDLKPDLDGLIRVRLGRQILVEGTESLSRVCGVIGHDVMKSLFCFFFFRSMGTTKIHPPMAIGREGGCGEGLRIDSWRRGRLVCGPCRLSCSLHNSRLLL